MLPTERRGLQEHLNAFEYEVKLPVSDKKRGTGAHTAGGESEHQSTQASGGRDSYSTVLSSGSQATSRSSSSGNAHNIAPNVSECLVATGRQTTLKLVFQKSPSNDIGLIVSEEIYRCQTFFGVYHYTFIQSAYIFCITQLLVLGFEYNTKAEHLITSGEVRVLDVITSLNDKEVHPSTYNKEVSKNRSCSLELKRWISLPQLKPLMDKGTFDMPEINLLFLFFTAEFSNPTSLVAVMNPKDYPNCSTEKGFGLGVAVSHDCCTYFFCIDHSFLNSLFLVPPLWFL